MYRRMLPTRIRALDLSIPDYTFGIKEFDGLPLEYPDRRLLNVHSVRYTNYRDYCKHKFFSTNELHIMSAGTIAFPIVTKYSCFLQTLEESYDRLNTSNDFSLSSESSKREGSDSESNWSDDERTEQNNITSVVSSSNTTIEDQLLPDSTVILLSSSSSDTEIEDPSRLDSAVILISSSSDLSADEDIIIIDSSSSTLIDDEVSDKPTTSTPNESNRTDSVVDSTTCDEQLPNLEIQTATPEEIVDSYLAHCPEPIILHDKTTFDSESESDEYLDYDNDVYRASRDWYYSDDEYVIRPPTPPKPKGTFACDSIEVASDYSSGSDDLHWCKKNANIRPPTPPKWKPIKYPKITILYAADELKEKLEERKDEGSEQDKQKDDVEDPSVKRPRLD